MSDLIERRYKPCGSDSCCYTNDREYVETLEAQNKELKAKCEYLDIPLFLRDPEGLQADIKAEFDKLQAQNKALFALAKKFGAPVSGISFVTEGALIWTAANELQARIEYANKESERIEGMSDE